jgi:hypothetical protein
MDNGIPGEKLAFWGLVSDIVHELEERCSEDLSIPR